MCCFKKRKRVHNTGENLVTCPTSPLPLLPELRAVVKFHEIIIYLLVGITTVDSPAALHVLLYLKKLKTSIGELDTNINEYILLTALCTFIMMLVERIKCCCTAVYHGHYFYSHDLYTVDSR